MSISSSLSNALSGLNVTSRMAEVVSENLANALTEGYGRRSLETSSTVGGVRIDGITRSVDRGLLGDRRLAEARLTADQRTVAMLGKIESLIGLPDDSNSITGRLAAFESALVSASADPASEQRLSQVNATLGAVVTKIQQDSSGIQKLRQDADAAINRDIGSLNSNLKMLESLNADISRARSSGQDPSSLFDARQQVIDEIGGIVPVRELDRGNDQIGLMTTSGLILIDGKAAQFEFSRTPTIVADMSLSSGGLSGITRDGVPLDSNNGFGRLSGGSLEAAFVLRDDSLVSAQQGLDEVALDLITRFNNPLVDPTVGTTGLLTDSGGPANPADIVGLSSRIAINATVDPSQGGSLSNYRDGVGAVIAGPTGNSAQLDRWLGALIDSSGAPVMTAADRMATFTSKIGANRIDAEKELSFTAARWDSLHNAELATGVDTDVELQNLLRVEQAYAANAKVIQTISAMMQQIMEI